MSNSLSLSMWEKLQLAWLLRGALQSENDSLIEAAERLVKQRPDNWLLFYFLGDKYQEEGRYVDALRVCQKCVDLRPGDIRSAYIIATTYNTITRAAWSSDKEMKVVKDLQEPARLLRDKLDPILSQAALDKLDMSIAAAAANAIGWFEKALSLEPDRPARRQIKQDLGVLYARFPSPQSQIPTTLNTVTTNRETMKKALAALGDMTARMDASIDNSPEGVYKVKAYMDRVTKALRSYHSLLHDLREYNEMAATNPTLMRNEEWKWKTLAILIGLEVTTEKHFPTHFPFEEFPDGCFSIAFYLAKIGQETAMMVKNYTHAIQYEDNVGFVESAKNRTAIADYTVNLTDALTAVEKQLEQIQKPGILGSGLPREAKGLDAILPATRPAQAPLEKKPAMFDGYVLIGEVEAAIIQEPFLSALPEGSWHSNVTLGRNALLVEINKDDDVLVKNNWDPLTDETYWLQIIVPKVARLLAKRQSGLPGRINGMCQWL